MEWTVYGLPMYAVLTGIAQGGAPSVIEGGPREPESGRQVETFGGDDLCARAAGSIHGQVAALRPLDVRACGCGTEVHVIVDSATVQILGDQQHDDVVVRGAQRVGRESSIADHQGYRDGKVITFCFADDSYATTLPSQTRRYQMPAQS